MTLRLFETWQNQSLEGIFAECRELSEDADFPTVKRWREQGGKVLGHFQVYFPEEIAHAAGMLPLKMRGAPVEPTHSDSRFGSYLCSILKTNLELVLSNRVELDMFVTHPICDAARNLAAVWGRNYSYPCQILYLPQNANSKASAEYLRGEYDRVKSDIEALSGTKVTDEALRNSIAVYNENRSLLRKIYEIKRKQPWLLSGFEAYLLMNVGGMILREEHNEMLKAAIPLIEARPAKRQDKIRVVFEGGFCEQPPLDLIRAISQSCYIVDDDLMIGLRWIVEDVPLEGDLLMNMADAYLEKSSYSPVQHDARKPKEKMLLQRIADSGAEAAIITAAKMCEPGLEDQVTYTKALDEKGIPYFVGEFEENMTSFDSMEIQLETFTENLIFS
ncbi:MAG: 2-hydroxyacyl-CoA dehydratase [Anaerolineae bacterium]|nr:2-hydroxyacyl-CoA dehydratase [Anaerolineae bacterium]MBL8104576.1 2-hydroxyacyl-CoA dehydratase [Anaerolineales bacterium]MCC6297710.1 2-hydroxyacyl-CoA dehydratase [Anaerolineales bacterium]